MATYIYEVTTVPVELITLSQAKKQLKLDATSTVEDDILQGYIDAAIEVVENYTSTSVNQQKYKFALASFTETFAFMRSPVVSIDSVKYYDVSDTLITLASEKYELRQVDKYQSEIFFNDYDNIPTVSTTKSQPVEISVTTGYDATTLPKAIKQAILLLIGSFYENRQDTVEALPKATTNLLRKYRFHY